VAARFYLPAFANKISPSRSCVDLQYHLKLRKKTTSDLTTLCTGWTIVFEVWAIQPIARTIAKFEDLLDPAEMLSPITRYLELGESGFLPELAISPDIKAFAFCRRLFVLTGALPLESSNLPPPGLTSEILPSSTRMEQPNFLWKFDTSAQPTLAAQNVIFGPSNRLAYHEHSQPDSQMLRIVSFNASDGLKVSTTGNMNFDLPRTIKDIIFHPNLPILAFRASWWNGTYHRAIIWHFKCGELLPIKNCPL